MTHRIYIIRSAFDGAKIPPETSFEASQNFRRLIRPPPVSTLI